MLLLLFIPPYFRRFVGRVAGVHCCTPAPSEPDLRLSTHRGSSIPKAREGTRSCNAETFTILMWLPTFCLKVRQLPLLYEDELGAGRCPSSDGTVIQHSLTKGITACSRDGTPAGSLPAFAWGNVVVTQPLSRPLQASLRLLQHPLPAALSACLATCFPRGRNTGLPRSVCVPGWVRSRLFAGGSTSATGDQEAPAPDHVPFGSSLSAPLACSQSRRLSAVHLC